jgi:hypothetical protein
MPFIQKIDEKKFRQKPLYGSNHQHHAVGSGLKPISHHPIFMRGGAFDLAGIINAVGNTIAENKDAISTVASSAANMSKSVSDLVKGSKELDKLKLLRESKRSKARSKSTKGKQSNDFILSPEEIASLKKLGNGFVKK